MSSLIHHGAILTVSRLSNFAIVMIAPIALVRILNVEEYGKYQEFMLYAMLVMALSELHLDSSLTYFIPKFPDRHRAIASHTSVLVLALSAVCILGLWILRPVLLKLTNFDFLLPLAAYVFCYVNLNWLEYYWIARRRTDLVLYYTAGRLLLRVGLLLAVAYTTRDVMMMLWAIVGAEALRLVLVFLYLTHQRVFNSEWSLSDLKAQLLFASPVGASGLVQSAGRNIGKLFVASTLGPASLAYYTVGSYLIPVVRLIRGSIADVVFPELVRIRHDREGAVQLWQRTNVLYCVLLFPAFVVCVFYGELIITKLFTAQYLPALPIFQIYMIFLLRRCFNFDVLLRSEGKTGFVLAGSMLALVINVILMWGLQQQLGFIGPALAFIASEIVLELYYLTQVRRNLQMSGLRLVDWRAVGRVATGCLAGLPVLVLMQYVQGPALVRATIASVGFAAVSWFVAYRLGVRDIGKLVNFAIEPLRRLKGY